MSDIFEFWSRVKRGQKVHPADKKVFDRLNPAKHGFQLECLPGCFAGRLRSAPIVFLYLSPGFSLADLEDARTKNGIEYRYRSYSGNEPLRNDGPGARWVMSRTKAFANYGVVKEKVAFLNIGAYHSKDVKSFASLLALPSSRVSLEWAQNVLFPEAEAGKRVVVCMRSAAYWGLEVGKTYGRSLFVPSVTRSGHLINDNAKTRLVNTLVKRLAI